MSKCISLILVCLLPGFSKAQFLENFSDGNINSNPLWTGDTASFWVDPLHKLNSRGQAISESILIHTPSKRLKNQIWSFDFEYHFSPSSSNFSKFILASDQESEVYLKLGGESGNQDAVELFFSDSTGTQSLIRGNPGFFQKDSAKLKVRVELEPTNRWHLWIDSSFNFNDPLFQGTDSFPLNLSSEKIGIEFTHTSTRKDGFFLDNIQIKNGPLIPLSVELESDSSLRLGLSSEIDSVLVNDHSRFLLIPDSLHPTTISIDSSNSSSLILHFPYPVVLGEKELRIGELWDYEGNIMSPQILSFTAALKNPEYRDLQINEIFFDPSPQIGMPEYEFIEILNTTSKIISLKNLSIKYRSESIELGDGILEPGEYLILCDEQASLEYEFLGRTKGLANFPALLNSGGKIELIKREGAVLDKVFFDKKLFSNNSQSSGGVSLEQKNPNNRCYESNNWDGSLSPEGASPGAQNSRFDPEFNMSGNDLKKVEILDPYFIKLHFEKGVFNPPGFQEKFTVSDSILFSTLDPFDSLDQSIFMGVLTTPLEPGKEYFIELDTLTDCFENQFFSPITDLPYGKKPEFGELIITEYLPIPTDGSQSESIEIQNLSSSVLNVRGSSFSDPSKRIFLPEKNIKPGEVLLLTGIRNSTSEFFDPFITDVPSINNSGDSIMFLNQDGRLLHKIIYDPNQFGGANAIEGKSIYLMDSANWCDPSGSWQLYNGPGSNQLGKRNSFKKSQENLPVPKYLIQKDDSIMILFQVQLDSLLTMQNGLALDEWSKTISWEVESQFPFAIKTEGVIGLEEIQLRGFYSCSEKELPIGSFPITTPKIPGTADLRINEILFDPLENGSEFIEIVNVSKHPVWLEDLELVDQNGSSIGLDIFPSFIGANQFLVFVEDSARLLSRHPQTPKVSIRQPKNWISLPKNEGKITLTYQGAHHFEELSFDEDLHFELLEETKGISLERISLSNNANRRGNWTSASENSGFGTPGLPNSQFQSPLGSHQKLVCEPEIFSPDGDGFQDILKISIPKQNIGASVSIDIFSEKGILEKRLVSGQQLSNENMFFWDGINEKGQKSAFGNYLVLVRIFDPSGNNKQLRKVVGIGGFKNP